MPVVSLVTNHLSYIPLLLLSAIDRAGGVDAAPHVVLGSHDEGIRVVAHSPLSASGLLEESVLQDIGDRHGLTPSGVVLAWNSTQTVVPIPSSTTRAHIVSNLAAVSTRLSSDEIDRIDSLHNPDFER